MQASVVARREGFKSGFTGRPARPNEEAAVEGRRRPAAARPIDTDHL